MYPIHLLCHWVCRCFSRELSLQVSYFNWESSFSCMKYLSEWHGMKFPESSFFYGSGIHVGGRKQAHVNFPLETWEAIWLLERGSTGLEFLWFCISSFRSNYITLCELFSIFWVSVSSFIKWKGWWENNPYRIVFCIRNIVGNILSPGFGFLVNTQVVNCVSNVEWSSSTSLLFFRTETSGFRGRADRLSKGRRVGFDSSLCHWLAVRLSALYFLNFSLFIFKLGVTLCITYSYNPS